jgi:zinc transport system substrate-binding protein
MHARLLLPLLAATALSAPALAEDTTSAWRLFVSDHAAPKLSVIELATGDTLGTFPLASPASLYVTHSGKAVYAVQGAGNQVSAINSGIAIDDHGDHGDIEITAPAAIDTTVAGTKPVHFVEHDGQIALFFDGEGKTRVVTEADWLDGGDIAAAEFDSGAPHHGVAVPWGDYTIVSVPNAADPTELPIGVQVLDKSGTPVGDLHACADLHGEASSGNTLLIACAEGLLVVTGSGEPQIELLPYTGLPEGKSTTLIGGVALQYFLGNYGPDKVVTIDPVADEPFRLIDLPTRRVHFVVDPIRPKCAYVFTEDGKLNQIDVVAGTIAQSVTVTEPYSMDGEWSLPRPRIAVANDVVAVTDPNAGEIHLIDIATFTETRTIALEGAPYNIVAVGGSGVVHGEGDAHAHSHDDQVYKGYFEDSQIADRTLADWAGDWQSVYPLLLDGTLAPVMEHKAEAGTKTAEEYTSYYTVGYKTDVNRITIAGDTVTFYGEGEPAAASYAYDGYEVLTYEKGNRGVRFIFTKTEGADAAPQFIQFSDHAIAPQDAGHYHLYWGDDRAALLEELTNWPTYYPSELSAEDIVGEMIAH